MRHSVAWGIWGVAFVACPVAWVPLGLANGEGWVHAVATALVVPVLPTVGLVLTLRRPRNPIGQLLLIAGSVLAVGSALTQLATWLDARGAAESTIGWVMAANNVAFLGLALVPLIVLLFPDGRPPSPRWSWAVRTGTYAVPIAVAASVFGPRTFDVTAERVVSNPAAILPLVQMWTILGVVAFVAILVTAVAAAASIVVRWRRSRGDERAQLQWVAWTASMGLVLTLLVQFTGVGGSAGVVVAVVVMLVAFPLSILVAILKYRLYDIDVLVDASTVYVALAAVLTALYLVVVTVIPAVFGAGAETIAGVVAAALVAITFAPVRSRLQQMVSRRLFGFRDEPGAALNMLGEAFGHGDDAVEVRAALAEAVATSLRLPFAAITYGDDAAVSFGQAVGPITNVDLTFRGEVKGSLAVSGRSASEPVNARDRRVLEELAVFVAVAVNAAAAADQINRSRAMLVSAREDERRRIRRDLHDGLGPALTALGFGLDTTKNLLRDGTSDERVVDQVERLRRQVDDAIADIRRLVHDLRPPALDDLGLAGALAAQAASLSRDDLNIVVRSDDGLDHLPAAVEVAAFRIASEAMNNVARHAQARMCHVSISNNGALSIEVTDDGIGIENWAGSGLGLASMHDRIDEVRGRLQISNRHDGGTSVHAVLPTESE